MLVLPKIPPKEEYLVSNYLKSYNHYLNWDLQPDIKDYGNKLSSLLIWSLKTNSESHIRSCIGRIFCRGGLVVTQNNNETQWQQRIHNMPFKCKSLRCVSRICNPAAVNAVQHPFSRKKCLNNINDNKGDMSIRYRRGSSNGTPCLLLLGPRKFSRCVGPTTFI